MPVEIGPSLVDSCPDVADLGYSVCIFIIVPERMQLKRITGVSVAPPCNGTAPQALEVHLHYGPKLVQTHSELSGNGSELATRPKIGRKHDQIW